MPEVLTRAAGAGARFPRELPERALARMEECVRDGGGGGSGARGAGAAAAGVDVAGVGVTGVSKRRRSLCADLRPGHRWRPGSCTRRRRRLRFRQQWLHADGRAFAVRHPWCSRRLLEVIAPVDRGADRNQAPANRAAGAHRDTRDLGRIQPKNRSALGTGYVHRKRRLGGVWKPGRGWTGVKASVRRSTEKTDPWRDFAYAFISVASSLT